MKIGVVGYGSIAKKHIDALNSIMGSPEIYLLRRKGHVTEVNPYTSTYWYDEFPEDIDFFIISNPTSVHYDTLLELVRLNKPILLEKPPVLNISEINQIRANTDLLNLFVFPAFNLRFHPLIKWMKDNITIEKVIEIQIYCGSYLPDWRPGKDYRDIYSAKLSLGGGVHLDLTHEMDYLVYFAGFPDNCYKFLSKKSSLEIETIDCAHYWLEYSHFNASIILNYYRRTPKRTIEIVTNECVFEIDLINSKVHDGKGNELFNSPPNSGILTYHFQMEHFINCIKGNEQPIHSLSESLKILELCL
jgi:predicted dehydrogenase